MRLPARVQIVSRATHILPNRRALIADDEPYYLERYARLLNELAYDVCATASDGVQALELIALHQPDFALLDAVMPVYDARGVLKRLSELGLSRYPHVIVMATPPMRIMLYDIEDNVTVCDKSADAAQMCAALDDASDKRRIPVAVRERICGRAKVALMELGISRRVKGFSYLAEAAVMYAENCGEITRSGRDGGICASIYEPLAVEHGANAVSVERAIRGAIESAWGRPAYMDAQLRDFGNTIDSGRGKPTNAEFIARVADKLLHGGSYESRDT